MLKRFKKITCIATLAMMIAVTGTACAKKTTTAGQGETKYPTKAIQVIVPVDPGGDSDVNARTFAKYLEKELGQSVVIVNQSGASGVIGSRKVKDAAPDGYTALFFHTELMIPYLMGLSDFTYSDFNIPGVVATDNTTLLAVNSKSKWNTLQDLIDDAKKNPGKIEFGVALGGYPHLIGLALEDSAKIDLNITDVGGNAQKTVALVGQKTDVINTQYGLTKDYFVKGDFRNLGVLTAERNPLIPDLKTAKEQGVDLQFGKSFFFALPKGTPKEISDKFAKAIENVTKNPEYQKEAKAVFLTPQYMNTEKSNEYLKGIQDQYRKYADLMKAATKK
jgi:tripartite-type tricarboxylate transporter receptor subunit TctC